MHKNVLIVSSEFPPMPGGIGSHAHSLAKELSDLGHSVTVLTNKRESVKGEWRNFIDANPGLKIYGIRRNRPRVFTYAKRCLHVLKLLHSRHWAAVIYSGKFSVWLCGIMSRSRSIVVVHGSEIKQSGMSKLLFQRGLERTTSIVCVSDFTKRQLTANYAELDGSKVSVINNGISGEWIGNTHREKLDAETELSLITVGGIHRRKGQFNVIKAMPRILEYFPNAKYHVVGLPLEKNILTELMRLQDVERHVNFYHGLTSEQVRKLLASAQIFIMLSDHLENGDFEGFGIAVVEAMALGLPAIGTRDSGIADAIVDGHSGELVNPKSPDEIVNALCAIIADYDRYSKNAIIQASRAVWSKRVHEYQRLIENL